jgi:hypothetical protein
MVMMTHDLFETYRFHLLPNAEKPTQVLACPSIWLLCGQNRSAVEILDQDLTNTANAMGRAMILDVFFSFFRALQWSLGQFCKIDYSINIGHLLRSSLLEIRLIQDWRLL